MKKLLCTSLILISIVLSSECWSKDTHFLALDVADEESYAESFTLVTMISETRYLLVQAMLTNGGFGDENPACRILFVDKQKKKEINEVERGGSWSYNSSKNTLHIGTCSLQRVGNKKLNWKAKTEKIELDIQINGTQKKLSTKAMQVKIPSSEHLYKNEILIANGQVQGWVKGTKLVKTNLKGHGFLNHTRSTTLPPELAKGWFKLYTFDSTGTQTPIILTLRAAPKQGQVKGWYHLNNKLYSLKKNQLEPLKQLTKKRLKKGQELILTTKKQETYTWQVVRLNPLFVYEPIKAYGMVGKLLKKWIGDPINYTSYIELKNGDKTLHGLIEEVRFR